MTPESSPLNVLVIEPHMVGHHGTYLQWMVEALVEHGFKVTIMTQPVSLQHPSLLHIMKAHPQVVEVVTPACSYRSNTDSLVQRELGFWRMFRNWYLQQSVRCQPDVVLLPYLDYCLYAIGLLGSPFGSTPWVGVAMRPSFHYHDMGIAAPYPSLARLKKALFFRLLKNKQLKSILTIDEPLSEYLSVKDVPNGKVVFLPEPYDVQVMPLSIDAKKKYEFDVNQKVILVYGAITSRKGVVSLLRAITDQSCPEFVSVLLAGKLADDMHVMLGETWIRALRRSKRLTVLDRFIPAEEEPNVFSAADIVWLGYQGHYTGSGVLVQAAKFGRPVIGCEDGVIGWQTRRHKMGVVVRQKDIGSVVAGIRTLIDDEGVHEKCGINGRRAFENNTLSNAKVILVNATRAQLSVCNV
jgi:glycosyltransferase involved in cell wall biosynthesis